VKEASKAVCYKIGNTGLTQDWGWGITRCMKCYTQNNKIGSGLVEAQMLEFGLKFDGNSVGFISGLRVRSQITP